ENCFSIDIVFEFAKQHQILAGTFPAALTGLIAWLLHRATKKDTKAPDIQESLIKLVRDIVQHNAKLENRFLGILEVMAIDLRPSVRKAFAPIGTTCRTMTVIHLQRNDN